MRKLSLFVAFLFITATLSAQKNVLIEESTGTWCQYCPGGIFIGDSLCEVNDNVIFVAVHTRDVMANEEYTEAIDLLSAPSANFGRHLTAVAVDNWFDAFASEENVTPLSTITVSNIYNSGTRLLTSTVTATSLTNMTGNYRLAAIVVEDCVHGHTSAYNQANTYSGSSSYVGGFEDMPNPVPSDRMAYDHVGRELLGGYDGVEGSFPASLNAGQSTSYEFTYTLPEDYNPDYIRVIGVLIKDDGAIDNAGISTYLDGNDNAAPIFTSAEKTKAFNETEYFYNIFTHDVDNKELTIDATTLPDWLTFEQTGRNAAVLRGTPSVNGDYEVTLEVSDGERVTEQSFTITVEEKLDGEWKYVGERAFNGKESYVHDMVFYGDICYVLVQEENKAVVYQSVDDGDWEQVGDIGMAMTYVQSTIDVAGNGDIYIGFSENGPDYTFIGHILKWDGNSWIDLDAPSASYDIFLRLDNEDTPYYISSTDQTWLGYVRKYVDGEWVIVGGGSIQPSFTMYYGLDFDSENVPYIQWAPANSKIHVSKLIDDQWVDFGEYVSFTSVYYYTSFAINDDDQMFVAMNNGGSRAIDVFTYQNDEWVKIGENIGNTTSAHMDMVIKDGDPLIVFADATMANSLSVMNYADESWKYIGQRAFTENATSYPQVAMRGNTIYTAFIESELGNAVSVMKYELFDPANITENHIAKTSKITCYPTISSTELTVNSEFDGEARILNSAGNCVVVVKIKKGINNLNINSLSTGLYIIECEGSCVRFIKN